MILSIVLSIGLCFIIGLGGMYLSPLLGRVLGSQIRAISLGAGFIWAHYQLSGVPPWPPHGSNESLFYIAALSPFLALFYAPRAAWPVLLSYLVSLAVLIPFIKQDWLWAQPTLIICTLCGVLWWRSIQRGIGELPSLTLLIISASFLSLGIHMLLNASALLGLLSIACSSLAIAAALTQWLLKKTFLDLQGFFALIYVGFIATAYYYLDSPIYKLVWISLALLLVFPPFGPPFSKRNLWIGLGIISWLSSLIPL